MSWLLIPSLQKGAWSEPTAFVIGLCGSSGCVWCSTTHDEILGSLDNRIGNCDNYYQYISSSLRNTKWSFTVILAGNMSQKMKDILIFWIQSKNLIPHPNILLIILDVHDKPVSIIQITIMLPRSISDEPEWELKVKTVLITWWRNS